MPGVPSPIHWPEWHRAYEDPRSSLSRRLATVQHRLAEALDRSPAGPLTVISACAGQGRDVIEVVAGHRRRLDVRARLVELHPELVAEARRRTGLAGLSGQIEVIEGDASVTDAYAGMVPADVVLVCGVFGNVSDDDVRRTVEELRHLTRRGGTVIWTRHRLPPDLTPALRRWFTASGFEELAFDADEDFAFGVGTAILRAGELPFAAARRMFTFLGDGADAHR